MEIYYPRALYGLDYEKKIVIIVDLDLRCAVIAEWTAKLFRNK